MGKVFGQAMSGQINAGNTSPNQQTTGQTDPLQKLEKLKKMFDSGFINEQEYSAKKQEILSQL
jgi:hypothetical protein